MQRDRKGKSETEGEGKWMRMEREKRGIKGQSERPKSRGWRKRRGGVSTSVYVCVCPGLQTAGPVNQSSVLLSPSCTQLMKSITTLPRPRPHLEPRCGSRGGSERNGGRKGKRGRTTLSKAPLFHSAQGRRMNTNYSCHTRAITKHACIQSGMHNLGHL